MTELAPTFLHTRLILSFSQTSKIITKELVVRIFYHRFKGSRSLDVVEVCCSKNRWSKFTEKIPSPTWQEDIAIWLDIEFFWSLWYRPCTSFFSVWRGPWQKRKFFLFKKVFCVSILSIDINFNYSHNKVNHSNICLINISLYLSDWRENGQEGKIIALIINDVRKQTSIICTIDVNRITYKSGWWKILFDLLKFENLKRI